MHSLWDDRIAQTFGADALALRVYSSRLLGQDPSLVLHGGGNTSVKLTVPHFLGGEVDALYVKGSGWDLATIQTEGFSPVRMDALLRLAEFETLSDSDMVRQQRAALLNPSAPTPSVEAILHALIPSRYVDHTHADAVLAVMNTPNGEAHLRTLYGERVLILPYVMPGFKLARLVYERTRSVDWSKLEGLMLLNHGVFTFGETAQQSYERMIDLVNEAEAFLHAHGATEQVARQNVAPAVEAVALARLRREVSHQTGKPVLARLDQSAESVGFAQRADAPERAGRGTLTPDHMIRLKHAPLFVPTQSVTNYAHAYQAYFDAHATPTLTRLDDAPRWAVWEGVGTVYFGDSVGAVQIVQDLARHTMSVTQWATALGGWIPLPLHDLFEVEYWELEQAKLKQRATLSDLVGKVALVTGAASGIGRASVEALQRVGVAVIAIDLDPTVHEVFSSPAVLSLTVNVTDADAVRGAVEQAVKHFGGLDILVNNAGIFPPSRTLEAMDATWERTLAVNLSGYQYVLQACIPYLRHGIDPTALFIGSKNFYAPGPGAGAYSVSKAGMVQLARVAALELAQDGIRVNVIHPNAVFDTGIWTDEVLQKRAEHYRMSIEEYKRNNLLGVSITSEDVARMVLSMAGSAFYKTTGAQVTLDGGNDRVI